MEGSRGSPMMKTPVKAAVLYGARDVRIEVQRQQQLDPDMVLLRPRRAGICGSDLHYYEHGRCGAFVPSRPFVLGHELCAEVVEVGSGVTTLGRGQRVTVNPARCCGYCEFCRGGRLNLCERVVMLGSASITPPMDGVFAECVAVRWDQCHILPVEVDDAAGAMIEPIAVALHAVKRARGVSGRRVLVIGGGPIGLLVATLARAFGAVPVAVSEIVEARRKVAAGLGVDAVFDPMANDLAARVGALTGRGFDVIFEASGSGPGLRSAFDLVRPGGTIVQVGTFSLSELPISMNRIMTHEISLVGSMRYDEVFGEAIRLVARGRLKLAPLISDVFDLDEVAMAMQTATDKAHALKVQLRI